MDTILIFGGTGCLGQHLIEQYTNKYHIVNFSRDEHKHWMLDQKYGNGVITHVIGDAIDSHLVRKTILRYCPTRILLLHALKHVDRCQTNIHSCIQTNLLSVKKVLDVIEDLYPIIKDTLQAVLFTSTDKATSPINAYGMCKGLAEMCVMEKASKCPSVKFVCVRYGNVMNSTSSIVPALKASKKDVIELTDNRMTRFYMTIEDACKLVDYALTHSKSGDIVIPKLRTFYVKDLLEVYSKISGKTIVVTGLRPGERLYEVLINDTQSLKTVDSGSYYHITGDVVRELPFTYDSNSDLMSKEDLEKLVTPLFQPHQSSLL